ncbi:hypothetical protein [Vibrio sp. CyArs1]|uniref:hypothetical protein n=1 Tax=Vibrio sp. CyArs1 TaxID=2682577 RepID=UPI001F0520D2|nr:hypothetical protein [Vibrio sp. CyArs1]
MVKKRIALALVAAAAFSTQANASTSTNQVVLPQCTFDYANISQEFVQRVAVYVTDDVLKYATREDVLNWLDEQLEYSNKTFQNSCVKMQQELAIVRFVESPDDQLSRDGSYTLQTNEMTVVTYNDWISGLDIDSSRPLGVTTPMGRTSSVILDDWKKRSIDRVVSVRPYYLKSGSGNTVCGVANGKWSRPNAAPQLASYAPYNSWGENSPSSDIFSTVAYHNDPVCISEDLIAHEINHTNGLAHERGNQPAVNLEDTLGLAYECGGQRSLMYSGINNQRDVPFLSTPDITINGVKCGVEGSSWGVNSVETLHFNLGISILHNSPRQTPYQGVIDAGDHQQVGDTSTWNYLTNARHGNMVKSGSVSIDAVPNSIVDQNGTFTVTVSRTDVSKEGSALVRILGKSNTYSGTDFDSEAKVDFAIGESQKIVTLNTFASGLMRNTGTVDIVLHSPYQMDLGTVASITVPYVPSQYGDMGKVKILNATAKCVTDCQSGVVNLLREGGTQGSITATVTLSNDGKVVDTQNVVFAEGETAKTVPVNRSDLTSLLVTVDANHPSLVTYGGVKFTNDSGPINPPSGDASGGGGSTSLFAFIGLLLALYSRKWANKWIHDF